MESYHILIVEDDKEILDGVGIYMKNQGYTVFKAQNGLEGLKILENEVIHLAIVDIMMPIMDGITMTMKLRENYDFPVIMLSAKSEEIDKVTGLNIGADDYVTKPFYMGELLARIRVAMRKRVNPGVQVKEEVFCCDYLTVDNEQRKVFIDEEETHLTPIEFKILNLLISNRGKVLTHHYIMEEIWGSTDGVEPGNLRVFMAGLRRKIEKEPAHPRFILTEVGVGYRFSS